MKKIIWLYWFRKRDSEHGNFGDELSYYIISRLAACEVKHLPYPRSGIKLLLSTVRGVLVGRNSFSELFDVCQFLASGASFVLGIGSIISWGSGPKRIVWGSGIISRTDEIPPARFLAVRGHETRKRLIELGYSAPDVVGDPALLLPLVYKSNLSRKYKIGFVLHHIHAALEAELAGVDDSSVIHLTDPIELTIDKICSCDLIVSTSLHGIIVAHAYGKPAVHIVVASEPLNGDGVKFLDYYSSVGIRNLQNVNYSDFQVYLASEQVDCYEYFVERSSKPSLSVDNLRDQLLQIFNQEFSYLP